MWREIIASAQPEARTLGETLSYEEAEALIETLCDTLEKAETLGDKPGDVEAEALVDTVTCTLVTAEAETLGDTSAMWTPRH